MTQPILSYVLKLLTDEPKLREKYTAASKKLLENTYINQYKDSGFDLYVPEEITIEPGEIKLIDLKVKCAAYYLQDGFGLEWPSPYYLYARSSVSKRGIMLVNSVGIIDSGYRGNLMAAFYNTKKESVIINEGDRLVQICLPALSPEFEVQLVDKLDKTTRGEGGLGSTGK